MENKVINGIIDELYELVQDARNVPLSADKCIVERDAILDLLDEITATLPSEIKQAQKIISSRDELVNNARKEAEETIADAKSQAAATFASANSDAERIRFAAKNEADDIVRKAKEQAQEMVTKESIYKEAEKQSKDMLDKTNAQIAELRAVSNKYILDSLSKAAETIEASLRDVNETRAKFESLTGKDTQMASNKAASKIDIDIE